MRWEKGESAPGLSPSPGEARPATAGCGERTAGGMERGQRVVAGGAGGGGAPRAVLWKGLVPDAERTARVVVVRALASCIAAKVARDRARARHAGERSQDGLWPAEVIRFFGLSVGRPLRFTWGVACSAQQPPVNSGKAHIYGII